jgi:hypothetical protein
MANENKQSGQPKTARLFKYLFLVIISAGILLICGLFRKGPLVEGEYRYSDFIQTSYYTLPAIAGFFITGYVAGYYWNLNPWLSGLCLFFIFPLTAIIEGTVYPGSHSLIPFEFVFFFGFSIPSILAVYWGRHTFKQREKQTAS